MAIKALLIDYNYCTGCHTCTIACQMEKSLPDDKNGLIIQQVGPLHIEGDSWEYDYIPVPTDFCDLCADRTAQGKAPNCVQHCQADCMSWGEIEDMARKISTTKQVLFSR